VYGPLQKVPHIDGKFLSTSYSITIVNNGYGNGCDSEDDVHWTNEVKDIESETREGSLSVLELDVSAIVQRLNAASVCLSKIQRDCEAALFHLEKAQKMIRDVRDISPSLANSSDALMKHVTFLVDSRKDVFMRLQNLQRRSQTRLTLVRSYLNCLNINLEHNAKYA